MIGYFKSHICRVCVPLFAALPLLVACSSSGESDANVADDSSIVAPDTIVPVDTVPVVDKKEKPYTKFHSAEEAREFMSNSPYADKYKSGILWEMAGENLSYCEKLLNNEYKYFIVVDKNSMHVVLYDKYGNLKKAYGMACARNFGTKHKKSDCRTPEGFFYASYPMNSTEWLYTDDDGVTHPEKGVYGPRFIRLMKNDSTGWPIGIHGTGSPGSIGKRVSHGCIRVTNDNILDLSSYVTKGVPIIVSPSKRDAEVNKSEGFFIASVNTGLSTSPVNINVETPKKPASTKDSVAADADSVASGNYQQEVVEEPAPVTAAPDTVR